ncbi:DUF4286 family protein [Neolewinella lacunae]|uniref:DUF4286 family protein n=1 Tax=Neolewinella lacunae TaxID=1517758 RepID=A0A923PNL3_9BACT|nr:DUF4286 family protein [Neolewinella lacunae]MBC6994548.1 DUF4286 family protein [Neolewinella lacunae]MDN3634241.1 DUF4286 family protein [Neolewinella lacunae]
MMIYNVTSKVEHHSHDQWLQWMEQAYLPHVMDSGTVEDFRLARLLGVDESDGVTYALLLTFASRPAFDIYQEKFALDHQRMIDREWKGKLYSFPSLLEVVAEGQ